ncbi:hypothetical protein MB02_14080 [Croceicoccus estronivorus]|uniref:DUF2177 family protein n=1 Tax=Croceicoccus estronivorus TaxID=1172626 RepID=UPI0008299826|nr:DUF2177 family protein [Croceicoccus estronivorus]OCC22895.1 hypothetical protein MB02_14080 [Croceicoccus estronivorus]
MMPYVYGWLASGLAFLALDAVWLSQMTARFYRPAMGDMLADKPRFLAAAAFYILYITGLLVLAVLPAVKEGGPGRAALLGAVVGLLAYGTYDLTNQATLREWPLRLTVIDMAWGTVLTSLAACAGYCAIRLTHSAS